MMKMMRSMFVGFFLLVPSSHAFAVIVEFTTLGDLTGTRGETFLNIGVSGLGGKEPVSIGAFDIEIPYDASGLVFNDVDSGFSGYLGDPDDPYVTSIFFENSSALGTLRMGEISFLEADDLHAIQGDSIRLGVVFFDVIALGDYSFNQANIVLSDAFGFEIPTTLVGTSFSVTAVPEPSTIFLMTIGLAGLRFASRKDRQHLG